VVSVHPLVRKQHIHVLLLSKKFRTIKLSEKNKNTMKSKIAYIGLGSNLARPYSQIKMAIIALNNLAGTKVTADSGYFKSRPMGPEDQPDYVNAVVELETVISAEKLLTCCQQIEKQQNRIKTRHWGERTIDLDMLLYSDDEIKSENLTVPHPGICQRDFVYMPLLKVNAEIVVPGMGKLNKIVNRNKKSSDFACQFAGSINS
jgi:2-amino-4-hydroxy-6-hydroxymethyldihydropteridine diphosphokinase